MTGQEYRALIRAMIAEGKFTDLGHVAEWLGITRNGERKRAKIGAPGDTEKLLLLMAAMNLSAWQVDRRIDSWRKREAARHCDHIQPEPRKKSARRPALLSAAQRMADP